MARPFEGPDDLLHSLLVHVDDHLVRAEASRGECTEDIPRSKIIKAPEPQDGHLNCSTAPFHRTITTRTKMDIDSNIPPPSGQQNNSLLASILDPDRLIGKTYTLEEWDAKFPIPSPSQITKASAIPAPLPPVRITGETVARVNHLCQVHSIVPEYTFPEISKGIFTSTLKFGPHICEAEGPFSSKRQAKEAVAAKAIANLEALKVPRKEKRKLPRNSPSEENDGPRLNDENWVGRLTEFTQIHRSTPARFQPFETDARSQQMAGLSLTGRKYAFTVTLDMFPNIFGSESALYESKAEAKRAAARDAVLWLRANGHMPRLQDTPPTKRRTSATDDEFTGHTGLTQSMSKLNTEQSPAKLVADRSIQLGFSQPRFDMRPAPSPAGQHHFYTASAHYIEQDVQREPRLRGALCETQAVLGQKQAKEQCCKHLLGLLERILQDRL